MIQFKHTLSALGFLAMMPVASYASGGTPPVDICATNYSTSAELPVDPCPAKPPRAELPDLTPPDFSRERRISKPYVINRPGTVTFGHELIEWSGEEKCKPQRNAVPAIEVRASNVTIKDFGLKGSPGGIHIYGINVTLDNVTAWSCGESVVKVMPGAGRVSIKNSRFYGSPDFTDGLLDLGDDKIVVENSLFADSETCIKFGGGQEVRVEGSKFVGCKDSIYGSTKNNLRFSILDSGSNESWFGTTFIHLNGHVRGTSRSDLVYDGANSKLEDDAHLVTE